MKYALLAFSLLLGGCAGRQYEIREPREMDHRRIPSLKWNYYENKWSYTHVPSKLIFNYYEGKWEFSK